MPYLILNLILLVPICIILFYKPQDSKINYKLINKHYYKIVFLLFFLMIITSVYKLGIVPKGIHVDEAGMFYDAKLLAKFGYDRYLNKLPVYLINFGGGQSIMYAYLTAALIKLFGNKLILMRIPSIIFRIISFISAYFLIQNEENKLKRIIFLFLLAIVPYFIMQSRWGLDCNLLVSFMTISMSLFLNSIIKKNNLLLFLSGIFFGLSLYTYALSYIIIPIFLILIISYLIYIKKINIREIILFVIPLFILSLPLILMILVNKGIISEIHSIITIPKLPQFRDNEISFSRSLSNLRIFISILTFDKGATLIYNSIPYFGTVYYISIPFVAIGVISCVKKIKEDIKNKKISIDIIMGDWLISVIMCMLIIKYPNINKANAVFVPLVYLISLGIIITIKNSKKILKYILIIYIINFLLFIEYYYYEYNKEYDSPLYFATYYLEALEYAKNSSKSIIYIDPQITNEPYIYIFMKENISAKEYNRNIIKVDNKIYIISTPKKIDNKTPYITKNYSDKYNKKRIGDIYILNP